MSTTNFLLCGFGGQGILFAGKVLAYEGLTEDKQVSWLPSYGPEMRGGTANCNVIISDEPVGSPIVTYPDVLMAMNLPSLDKFEPMVVKGGKIFSDSTLIERKVERDDVEAYYIPATKIAEDNGSPTLANMVLTGYMLKKLGIYDEEVVKNALSKVIPARHADMFDMNLNALVLGAKYEG